MDEKSLESFSTVANLLFSKGLTPSTIFQSTNYDSLQQKSDSDPSLLKVDVSVGSEGMGFYLNRCVEISLQRRLGIEWFLVVGGDISAARAAAISRAAERAFEARGTILGLGVSDLSPSRQDLLDSFLTYRDDLASAGGLGFMMFHIGSWKAVAGFPEDVGTWGTELHFALDVINSGERLLVLPTAVDARSDPRRHNEFLLSGLVANWEHARGNKYFACGAFVIRTLLSGQLRSPGLALRSARLSREVLRSRRFLESGR